MTGNKIRKKNTTKTHYKEKKTHLNNLNISVNVIALLSGTGLLSISPSIAYAENSDVTYSPEQGQSISITMPITGFDTSILHNGPGTTILSVRNDYHGATNIQQGTLSLAGSGDISSSSAINISNSASFDISNTDKGSSITDLNGAGTVILGDKTLTLTNATNQQNYSGNISGNGGITLSGGNKTLTGTNNYTGDTNIINGTLFLSGTGRISKSSNIFVSSDGILDISHATQSVNITNLNTNLKKNENGSINPGITGGTINLGATNLNITNANSVGGHDENQGVIVGSIKGTGTIKVSGTKEVFGSGITGVLHDGLSLDISSTSIGVDLNGENDYSGTTTIENGGKLHVYGNARNTSQVTVKNGGVLSGTGFIGAANGSSIIEQGGTITFPAGNSVNLEFGGNLDVEGLSDFTPLSDSSGSGKLKQGSFVVDGDLTLNGIIKVTNLSGSLGSGIQNLYKYNGNLVGENASLEIDGNNIADKQNYLQTSLNQVNVALANGSDHLSFWDGNETSSNGQVDGGIGFWTQNPGEISNWTTIDGNTNSSWSAGDYAIFQHTGGTATVKGNIDIAGMQLDPSNGTSFTIASENSDSALTLHGSQYTNNETDFGVTHNGSKSDQQTTGNLYNASGLVSTIRVGNGSGSGFNDSATINVNITDDVNHPTTLVKTDKGSLTLGGINSYRGGTVIADGTLIISRDNNLGAANTDLAINGGILELSGDWNQSNRSIIFGKNNAIIQIDGHRFDANSAIIGPGGVRYTSSSNLDAGDAPSILNLNSNSTYTGYTAITGHKTSYDDTNQTHILTVNANTLNPFGTSTTSNHGGDVRFEGADINMNDGSSLGYHNVSASRSSVQFTNTGTAGNATITLQDSDLFHFHDNSTAGQAHITLQDTSLLQFSDNSSAGNDSIIDVNSPSRGQNASKVQFLDTSTAGSAIININGGTSLQFKGNSSAGQAHITENWSDNKATSIHFTDNSNADKSDIFVHSHSPLYFDGNSKSGQAHIGTDSSADVYFKDNSSADSANIYGWGDISFSGNSTATQNTTIELDHGGSLDISAVTSPNGLSIGSLGTQGASVLLGGNKLTIGSSDKDEIIAGSIQDGGANGGTGGNLIKVGTGKQTLSGTNFYTGKTDVQNGTLSLTGSIAGTLNNAAITDVNGGSVSGVSTNSGTLTAEHATLSDVTNSNGAATLTDSNAGAVTNNQNATFKATGGTLASVTNEGNMMLGARNNVTGDVVNHGGQLALSGDRITGRLDVQSGSFNVTSDNASAASLSGAGNGTLEGTLTLNNAGDTYSGSLSGNGDLTITAGTETLSGNNLYTGNTAVQHEAELIITGNNSTTGQTSIDGTLRGNGTVGGNVTINAGATLAAGTDHNPASLKISGNLILDDHSTQKFRLGQANMAGGQYNDYINIGGDLTLGGNIILEVNTDGPSISNNKLGAGVYNLYGYEGTLHQNASTTLSMASGLQEAGTPILQTSINHQVNVVIGGDSLNFWDGDNASHRAGNGNGNGRIEGGDGVWSAPEAGTIPNWTSQDGAANTVWTSGNTAIFLGSAGIVQVQDKPDASVSISGIQFGNIDGQTYVIKGDNLYATQSNTVIQVGNNSASGKNITAEINSVIDGSQVNGGTSLDKTDAGKLILSSDNNFAKPTIIDGGTLQLGNGGTTGSLGDQNITDNGTLAINHSNDVTLSQVISGTGSFVQQGTGTTTLSGTNFYTGETDVQNGTLNLTGSLAGALNNAAITNVNGGKVSGVSTNSGTLTAEHATLSDVTNSNGAATLTDSNAGAVTNNQNATFKATGGTLASVTNEGNMMLGARNNVTGDVVNHGGQLALSGDRITGRLDVQSGSFNVTSDNASAASLSGAGNGTLEGTLTLNNAGDTYSGSLSGNGDLTITAGTETLSGNNLYTGNTAVQHEAELIITGNNSTTGQTSIDGTLRGNGTVGGNVTINAGATLAAGTDHNPASLKISGNLTMNANSILNIRGTADKIGNKLDEANNYKPDELASDRILVSGKAVLNGGTLALHVSNPDRLTYGEAYRVMNAAQGVSGAYDKLQTNLGSQYAYLDPTLVYHLNDVDIVLSRGQQSFASPGETRNQIETGHGLDHISSNSTLAQAMAGLTKDQARKALDNLSGEVHASIRTALIQDSFFVRNAALNRLANSECDYAGNGQSIYDMKTHQKNGACSSEHTIMWGQAYGSLGHNSGTGNAAAMHDRTTGFIMGVDTPIRNSNWRVGGLFSYGHSMFNVGQGRSSSGNSNNVTVGGYAGTYWGQLHLRLGVAYSWNVINTRRDISVASYGKKLTSHYLGGTAQSFAELGYKMYQWHSIFEPFMNVAYVNMQTNSYREHNGEAALRGRSSDNGVTFATFGLHASTQFNLGKTLFMPHFMAAYRHAFGELGSRQHEAFAMTGGNNDMDIAGTRLSSNAAIIDTGITARLTDILDLDLSYIGQYGDHSTDSGATGSLKIHF